MKDNWQQSLLPLLEKTLQKRLPLLDDAGVSSLRLFNGFTEGYPSLTADLYGSTILLMAQKTSGEAAEALLKTAGYFYTRQLPHADCVVAKQRAARDENLKRGVILHGSSPATWITENSVVYALDLLMNQDSSFYLDTRNLRAWLRRNSQDRDVLNTFAYTGSLGVAAQAGGAARVVQIDRNRKFLELAQRSAQLNPSATGTMKTIPVDFFVGIGQLKQRRESFDIVILDPPYFSVTEKGRVDQVTESARLVNKVRPLVKDGGKLVVVNNALFLGGADFIGALEELGSGGYLSIDEIIPIPEDFTGYPDTRTGTPPADPAPFNHSTKLGVLSVRQKGRTDAS